MTLATLLIAAGLALISIVSAVIARSQGKTAVTRFSRRFGLDVPPGMDETIRAGVQARRIGAPIGAVLGIAVATVLLLVFPGLQLLAIWWCLFGSYLLGAGLGSTIAIFVTEGRRESGVVRVARTRAVTVGDYVSPYQSAFVWFCVVIVLVAFAGDLWLAATVSPAYLSIVSGVLAGLSVITLIVYQIIARRAVARGALAGTPLELAWDDALRSYALVNLSGMVGIIALYSLIAYDTLTVVATPHMASQTIYGVYVGLLPIAATVGVLTLIVVMTSIHSRQHFLRRLWPELAPAVDPHRSDVPTDLMGSR